MAISITKSSMSLGNMFNVFHISWLEFHIDL